LTKHDGNSATIKCTDGNDNALKLMYIPFTDFKPDEATVWVEGDIALLPSEH